MSHVVYSLLIVPLSVSFAGTIFLLPTGLNMKVCSGSIFMQSENM